VQPVLERLAVTSSTLQVISEQQLISDRAKQVAFREKDRDAFRRAIQEDIAKGDYEAAFALVDDMDAEFGYKAEAVRIRAELTARRDELFGRQLDDSLKLIDRFAEMEQWPAAFKEVERLKSLFPDQTRVHTLLADVEEKRQAVKRQLLGRWHEQVRARNVDEAIGILRKLDLYLTPVEAAGLEEDARMIFKEKLARLRESFKDAVQKSEWVEAKRIGEMIMADYPNTQMAREVKEILPSLDDRLRAAGAVPAMA
jgi:hypothetical protein